MVWYVYPLFLHKFYEVYGIRRISRDWLREEFGKEVDVYLTALINLGVVKADDNCVEVNVDEAKKFSDLLENDVKTNSQDLLARVVKNILDNIQSGKIRPVEC